jgi:uncharacterized protein YgiM (DUF1202 family)
VNTLVSTGETLAVNKADKLLLNKTDVKRYYILIGSILLTICSFGQMKVISRDVNFRTSPENKENKICIIPKGAIVTIVQDNAKLENWTKIIYNGKTGYVSNDFLKNVPGNSKSYTQINGYSNKGVKYYKNSKGEKVQSPTHYDSAPASANALCNDGTYSFSKSRRGTCSHHGGVKKWL